MEEKKNPLKSKTLWVNALMAMAMLLGLNEKLNLSEELLMSAMAVVNMVLRLVTKDKIGLE